jgi:hypothetical protein
MSVVTIGLNPRQVSFQNLKRRSLTIQHLPTSLVAGNTGNIFGKWGSAPKADLNSNTWDFVLNPGATDGVNLDESQAKASRTEDLWLISDTASQQVNVIEHNTD